MNRKIIALALFLSVFYVFSNSMAQDKPVVIDGAPEAYFPESSFTFSKVLEGAEITHDFVVKNKGTAPLSIDNVKTT